MDKHYRQCGKNWPCGCCIARSRDNYMSCQYCRTAWRLSCVSVAIRDIVLDDGKRQPQWMRKHRYANELALRRQHSCAINREQIPKIELAMIDLVLLYNDRYLNQDSFADLSTETNFDKFFDGQGGIRPECLKKIEHGASNKFKSAKQKEVLLGCRGEWWTPYAVLVTPAGALQRNQVGGSQGRTRFGDRWKEKYGNQYVPLDTAGPAPPSTASSSAMSHNKLAPRPARPCPKDTEGSSRHSSLTP